MHSREISKLCLFLFVCLQTTVIFSQEIRRTSLVQTSNLQLPTPVTSLTNALDKRQLEIYLRHLYIWPPEFQVEIGDYKTPPDFSEFFRTDVKVSFNLNSIAKVFMISKDGKRIMVFGEYPEVEAGLEPRYQIDVNPFQGNLDKIDTSNSPGFGTKGAPVVIVVYSDFECSHCAREARTLRTKLLDDYPHDVRVYYRDFPIPRHKWARPAAIAGQCLGDYSSDMYWEYFDWVFSMQRDLNAKNFHGRLNAFAEERNIDTLSLYQCIESDKSSARLKMSIDEGTQLNVRSTPTMFINGRKVVSVEWSRFKRIIDNELVYQKVAQNAGDDCGCSVSPQIPGFE